MYSDHDVLQLAVTAGEILLKNGAEIFRVQETITRILDAFQISQYNVYVISNGIFATVNENNETGCFSVRDVPLSSLHLERIAAVNELSREIAVRGKSADVGEMTRRLYACESIPAAPFWRQLLSGGVGAGCFCIMYGGNMLDAAAAFACGFALKLFLHYYGRDARTRFTPTIIGGALISFLASLMTFFLPQLDLDYIITGAIILLVPGVAFTTAIRDFFYGDYISGNIHIIEAILTGTCIAIGVGVPLQLWNWLGGGVF